MKKKLLPTIVFITGLIFISLYFLTNTGEGSLGLNIQPAKVIMPAAYKVYANPEVLNGKYYLFKMMITNTGKKPFENIKVSYRVPKFIEWTELETIKRLNTGQSAVLCCYPVFNDNIVDKTTSSHEKTEIKLVSGDFEKEEKFDFELKGRNDFVYTSIPTSEISSYHDIEDNNELLACFITPEDPIIKYYTQQIQEKLLKGETASVSKDADEAVRFLMGIYDATERAHMVYSGTKGVPSGFDDIQSIVQHLRLPREVVTGNTGLCIELSLLYASVLANEGLSPIVYLIPGHAYPGFKLNGQYYAIEATAIGGEGIGGRGTAQQALKKGMEELDEFVKATQSGDPRYSFIDINDLIAQGVLPMELRDDAFMRQKIDEIAKLFTQGGDRKRNYSESASTDYNNSGNYDNSVKYSGNISFNYPFGWQRINKPNPQLPFVVSNIISPDRTSSIEIYNLSGFADTQSALDYLTQIFASNGLTLQYEYAGQKNNGFEQYNGFTMSMNGNVRWVALFRARNNNVSGLAAGTVDFNFSQYQNIFNQILSTVK